MQKKINNFTTNSTFDIYSFESSTKEKNTLKYLYLPK